MVILWYIIIVITKGDDLVQDNLLRKEDTNALNLVVHENPHQKRILEIEN